MLHSDGTVTCDYCGKPADLVAGTHTNLWECQPCDAYVACHPNSPTYKPTGRLANAELRAAKKAAHSAFDPLWQAVLDRRIRESGGLAYGLLRHRFVGNPRADAYRWLADQLGIDPKECHFGKFDLQQCKRVVEVVEENTPSFMHGLK